MDAPAISYDMNLRYFRLFDFVGDAATPTVMTTPSWLTLPPAFSVTPT